MFNTTVAAIILAAGKGTRLGCTDKPKVMLELAGKPMVEYTIETLEKIGFASNRIVVVVGFFHEVVENYFKNRVTFAHQNEQRGTAHATMAGVMALPKEVKHFVVMGGDDSTFYEPETITRLIQNHLESKAIVTLLSVQKENPGAYGRIVRDHNVIKVIEKEYTTEEQKKITEVSTGTYCFDRDWFEKNYPNLPILQKLNEWVLPLAFAAVAEQGLKQNVVTIANPNEWFGVNTPEELTEAQRRKSIV